jgi:hypothetical protein
VAAISGGVALWHHEAVVSGEKKEDTKIEAVTSATVQQVQKVDNEIRNIPSSDKRTIERLQHGSYFPQR